MKVLIAGFYGFGNLGDELILSSILDLLHQRHPTAHATVLSHDPEETRRDHRVAAVSRWRFFSVLAAVWRNDVLLFGGGGLFQDGTSARSMIYYLGLLFFARLTGTPVVVYALGVEKLSRALWSAPIRWTLSGPRVTITVRDAESRRRLTDMGLDPHRVAVTADPVFARPGEDRPRERYRAAEPAALLIPRFPCPPEAEALLQQVVEHLTALGVRRVAGVLFQPSVETEALRTETWPAVHFLSGLDLEARARAVGDFDVIVSTRFHGLVLAALAGRPFLGVGDPEKIGRFCATLGQPFLPWSAVETDVAEAVERLLGGHPLPEDRVAEWRRAAQSNIEAIVDNMRSRP